MKLKRTLAGTIVAVLLFTACLCVVGAHGVTRPTQARRARSDAPSRALPRPLSQHPGNIFLDGQKVIVSVPTHDARWRLVDYDGKSLGEPAVADGKVSLGELDVGFYRLEQIGSSNWVSLGVLAPLSAATPMTSPIAMDVAMAWFYPKEAMDQAASLCALAGVNWVRDRLNWGEMEPKRGEFASTNKYDFSAAAQAGAGLNVLQVIHASPGWANRNGKRFPLDLRDAHRFFAAMARRWRGQVLAFEPWNEADIPMFGGHTGSEMASLQKAAYLGLKKGNPEIIACLNVFAHHNTHQLADLHDNEAWPYFDTYNLHHYEPFDRYPALYADHRAVSAGKPLWVTECAVPVKWAGNEKLKEPTDADLRVQSERVAKTFACSLHEGSAATFYFLLPHYVEGQTQFGIVRPDLTPRPAYVALAAAGRLLADAKPLGQVKAGDPGIRAYAFNARPDGFERVVVVAWTTNRESALQVPSAPEMIFDHLGRKQEIVQELKLTSAPQFVLLEKGRAAPGLTAPPQRPRQGAGNPSTIVLQAPFPEDDTDLKLSACRIKADAPVTIKLFAYNFGTNDARGELKLAAPAGWNLQEDGQTQLRAGTRKELKLTFTGQATPIAGVVPVRVTGNFGEAGNPVLSFRVIHDAGEPPKR